MKSLILGLFLYLASFTCLHADTNYSGIWKDENGIMYSIHQSDDSVYVGQLKSNNYDSSSRIKYPVLFTEEKLDVAIRGEGFFVVELADGSYGYTRNGNFFIDNENMLSNMVGKLVTENNQPIPYANAADIKEELLIDSGGVMKLINVENGDINTFDKIILASIERKHLQYFRTHFTVKDAETVSYYSLDKNSEVSLLQGAVEEPIMRNAQWESFSGKLINDEVALTQILHSNTLYMQNILPIEIETKIYFESESTAIFEDKCISTESIPCTYYPSLSQKTPLIKIF